MYKKERDIRGEVDQHAERVLCAFYFAASARLNSMASLRSLSSSFSSRAADRCFRSVVPGVGEDVEWDTETAAATLLGDAVPGLGDVFNGVFHALGGLPLDRWDFTGVVVPLMPPPRDETLSFAAGDSFSSERSEPVDIDGVISGDPSEASTFARGEAWTCVLDEDGIGRDRVNEGGIRGISEAGSRLSPSSRLSISTYSKASCSFSPKASNEPR